MGRSVIALVAPFAGLPLWAQLFFYFVCALIVGVLAWTGILFASSRRWNRTAPGPDAVARPTPSSGCSSSGLERRGDDR